MQEIICKENGFFRIAYWYNSVGAGGGKNLLYTPAYVLKTNFPGLDAYFSFRGQALVGNSETTYYQTTVADTVYTLLPEPELEFVLIWTGVSNKPVNAPVGAIYNLPDMNITVSPYYHSSTGLSNSVLWNVKMSGFITFVAPTCNTPDVTVNLGDHKIGRFISGEVTEMGRKAFNLALNCPINYGYNKYNPSDSEKYIWDDTLGTVQQTPKIENSDMTISFSAFDTLDTDRWIAKANPSHQSDPSKLWAEGVGVALYHSGGVRYRFDNTQSIIVAPIRTGGTAGIINVPLEAAFTYDATKPVSLLKPGNVNVAIEAVIQYN